MNIGKVNLDDLLVRNALPRFITDLEAAWRKEWERDERKKEVQYDAGTRLSMRPQAQGG